MFDLFQSKCRHIERLAAYEHLFLKPMIGSILLINEGNTVDCLEGIGLVVSDLGDSL